MAQLKESIDKYAKSEVNVLIMGLRDRQRAGCLEHPPEEQAPLRKFHRINCGSIPHELIESELFGYEKGSFTGPNAMKSGLFEIANNARCSSMKWRSCPPRPGKASAVIQDGEIEKIGRTGSSR